MIPCMIIIVHQWVELLLLRVFGAVGPKIILETPTENMRGRGRRVHPSTVNTPQPYSTTGLVPRVP